MKQFLQLGLLLLAAQTASFSQIYLRVTQGEVSSALNNGASVTVNAAAISRPVDFTVSIIYAGPGVLRFTGSPRVAGSPDFASGASTPSDVSLVPGQTVVVPVRFTASTPRLVSAQLTWAFTESLTQTQASRTGAVVVGMNGLAPSLDLAYSFALDGNFNPLSTADGVVPFPATPIHSITPSVLTLLNRGTGKAQIESITVTGGAYSLASLPILPTALNAGATLRFQVRFQPRTDGVQQGMLIIRYGDGQAYQVALRGEAMSSYLKYQVQTGTESPVQITPNSVIQMPGTAVGQRSPATIRFTNSSPFDISVPSIAVTGAGWVLADVPFTPLTMAPNTTQFFTLFFAPTQPGATNGRLRVGSDTFELSGEAQGSQLEYRYSTKAGDLPLSAGGTITFPDGTIGETNSISVTVSNKGTGPAPILTVSVPAATGNGFRVSGLPALPFSLAPRQSFQFTIQFKPESPGLTAGTLRINTDQFTLYGTAEALPDFPDFTIQGPTTAQAFEQPRISLVLAKAFPVPIRGTLALAVESDGYAIDPSTQFSTGGRIVPFTIPAGSVRAVFGTGLTEIRFQTGSVAGTFVLNASFTTSGGTALATDSAKPLRISLAQGAPKLLSGGVSRRSTNSLTLELIGITTTRSLTKMSVRVKPRAGYQIANTEYSQDLTGPSLLWFYSASSAGYGGQFVATLPLQLTSSGNGATGSDLVQSIESISVTFQNERGSSETMTVPIW